MRQQRVSHRLSAALLGFALAAVPSAARACEFHYLMGMPETSFWGTSDLKATTADAAQAALAQLRAQDAVNANGALGVVSAASRVTSAASSSSLDAIGAWKINWTGATGHSLNTTINANIKNTLSDVQGVWFDANNIYVKSADLPSYNVGIATANANTGYPADQGFTLRIPRNPTITTTGSSLTNGPVAAMANGAVLFDPGDAQTYNNGGIWHRVALAFEGSTFDTGPGHVAPSQNQAPGDSTPGVYHYHIGPTGLTSQIDPGNTGQHHSPIIGFAYDGFPIYGPYGYSNPLDPTSGIKRLTTSYGIRPDLTTGASRTSTTYNGTVLTASSWGPAVGATVGGTSYPAGSFKEDYQYNAGAGDLNSYNMRFEVTPEYPQGTWAYVMTVDGAGGYSFPYVMGPQYLGVVDTADLGPTGGHVTIPAGATKLLAGDSTFDGSVNYADLLVFARYYGKTAGALWSQGNYDANGTVDASDLALLQQNYTPNAGSTFAADWAAAQAAAVPEPSTKLGATLLGASAMLRRRRRRD